MLAYINPFPHPTAFLRLFTLNVRKSVKSRARVMVDSSIRIYVKFWVEIPCPTFEFVIFFYCGCILCAARDPWFTVAVKGGRVT